MPGMGASRRGAAHVAWLALLACLSAAGTRAAAQPRVTLTYLGTAGWEISDGRIVVLVDPYLSRLRSVAPNDDTLPGDSRRFFAREDTARSDTAVIDAHVHRADFILVTHSHVDHVLDVPYIARRTGATIIGTETTRNIARAYGVPGRQILAVRGGEDYQLGALSVRVIPSLHGVLRNAPYVRPNLDGPSPTPIGSDARAPLRVGDFRADGGTLAFLIRLGGREILAFGSMNYVEREVDGLRPDVALVGAMPERAAIHDYTTRLLRALGDPPLVLPTHWDAFNVPYGASQASAAAREQSFVAEVRAASPRTRVIVPTYFVPIVLPPN